MRLPALFATLIVTTTSAHAGEAGTHPFGVHDMLAMQRVSDPQLSPDGQRVVFGLRTTDLDANRGRSDLWIAQTDGEGVRQLTTDPGSESNPRWAPDGGSILFLSSRGGSSQVWRLPCYLYIFHTIPSYVIQQRGICCWKKHTTKNFMNWIDYVLNSL